ncbi:MAG: DUF4179 domain-containing protein [Eubacteriales bacterium]|nr:DUF4179 domain-containing protein [Eubacteriales bacterium]
MNGHKILQKQKSAPLDNKITTSLQRSFQIPDVVDAAKEQAFDKIRVMEQDQSMKREYPRKQTGLQKMAKYCAGIAAAAACFLGVCITNPVLAAQIPVVGHVFEQLGASLGFSGNFDKYADKLESDSKAMPEDTETQAEDIAIADSSFTRTDNGLTITLSEIYCNDKALYISMVVQSEENLKEKTAVTQNDSPIISLTSKSNLQFSFMNKALSLETVYLDGKFTDDHTYLGVLRYPLNEDPSISSDIPEEFQAALHINGFIGTLVDGEFPEIPEDIRARYEQAMSEAGLGLTDEDSLSFTEEQKDIQHQLYTEMWNAYAEIYPEVNEHPNTYENWIIDGSWDYNFDVKKNTSDTEVIEFHDVDENGLGLESITKTPFEIIVEDGGNYNYFTTVLDANGNPLNTGTFGGTTNTLAIGTQDVSKIDVYICDYIEYMDEIKGYYWGNAVSDPVGGEAYKKILDERALYHKEIVFDK